MRKTLGGLALAGLAAATAPAAHAAESYDSCTGFIDSLPATLATQGNWCLRADLATAITSGAAITIAANNVTLDCNGFKLGGLAAGAGTQADGILAQDRVNASVRNCNVRGFSTGIRLEMTTPLAAGQQLVEDNRLDGNTFVGIRMAGAGGLVRRNQVLDTGGSTVTQVGAAVGIWTTGEVDILDNTVSGVQVLTNAGVEFPEAIGISAGFNTSGSIVGNRVRGFSSPWLATGIYVLPAPDPSRATVAGNIVVGTGATDSQGITCFGSEEAYIRLRDNSVARVDTSFAGCGDAGGNVFTPSGEIP